MVPKLHKKGRSFKGAARYLLHDKDADTSDRVAWHATRNLATEDPDTAWRVMAATAMDQQRLKEEAGVKNTGRKSSLAVLHLTLSWHESEAKNLDADAMLAAAESALAALGASDRQALIVCHDDEPHPHVHILTNRVGDDGRMLSSSKEKLKLSAWAEAYEKERGKVWCDNRVINNAARRRGEYTRGVPSRARHVYEAEQQRVAANDNVVGPSRPDHKQKDAALSAATRQQQARQAEAWSQLESRHKQRVSEIRRETRRTIQRETLAVRETFRERWTQLHHEHQAEMRAFEQRETSLLGRIKNRFKAIDLGRIVGGQEKKQAIGEAFNALTTKGGRLEAVKRLQRTREAQLRREQRTQELDVSRQQRAVERQRLEENRQLFLTERSDLMLHHQMENARLRAQWLERHKERSRAMPGLGKRRRKERTPRQEPTHAADLLPKEGADQAASIIDQHKKQQRRRTRRRKRDNDRER